MTHSTFLLCTCHHFLNSPLWVLVDFVIRIQMHRDFKKNLSALLDHRSSSAHWRQLYSVVCVNHGTPEEWSSGPCHLFVSLSGYSYPLRACPAPVWWTSWLMAYLHTSWTLPLTWKAHIASSFLDMYLHSLSLEWQSLAVVVLSLSVPSQRHSKGWGQRRTFVLRHMSLGIPQRP